MIGGCAASAKPGAPPPVIDLAPYRCPAIDETTRAEFAARVERPKPDLSGGLSRDATRKWIDALEAAEVRKGATGLQVVAAYDRCRQAPAAPVTPPTT